MKNKNNILGVNYSYIIFIFKMKKIYKVLTEFTVFTYLLII